MLIDFTPEEQQQIDAIYDKYKADIKDLAKRIEGEENKEKQKALLIKLTDIHTQIESELEAFNTETQKRHFKPIAEKGDEAILAHALGQIEPLLKSLYESTKKGQLINIPNITGGELESYYSFSADKGLDMKLAAALMLAELNMHIEALKDNKTALKALADALIKALDESTYTIGNMPVDLKITLQKVATGESTRPLFSEPFNASFDKNLLMRHSVITDTLAKLSNKNIIVSEFTDKAYIQNNVEGYKAEILNYSGLKAKLSINTHKLLIVAIAAFTQLNSNDKRLINTEIKIPFYEYARCLDYEIDERPTDTPEAAKKERNRAKEAIKTARKRISQDLTLLFSMQLSWKEKVKGKEEDFKDIRIIYSKGIKDGYIIMGFSPTFAEYLNMLPLTYVPKGLLAIDARKPNAYSIGLKMAEHFSIDNNQIAQTANRLKVSTLLAVTQLPTYEDLQNEGEERHWEARIKEPFETALDELTGKVIADWGYTKAKGKPLTDEEAENITDFSAFSDLLIQFELIEAPNHKARLEKKEAEKTKAGVKAKKPGRKKKKPTDA